MIITENGFVSGRYFCGFNWWAFEGKKWWWNEVGNICLVRRNEIRLKYILTMTDTLMFKGGILFFKITC